MIRIRMTNTTSSTNNRLTPMYVTVCIVTTSSTVTGVESPSIPVYTVHNNKL